MRKQRLFIGIVLLLALFVLSACGTKDKLELLDETASTDLSAESVASVHVGSSESDVLKTLGEPIVMEETKEPKATYLSFGSSKKNIDLEVKIVDGKVVRYILPTAKYETEKNVSLENSKEEIIQHYGQNFYSRTDTGTEVIGYFDKEQKINLEFSFEDSLKGILVTTY